MKPSSSIAPDKVSERAQVSELLRRALWNHEREEGKPSWTNEDRLVICLRPYPEWPEHLQKVYAKTDAVDILTPGPVHPWMRELPAEVRAKFPELAEG